MTRREKIVLSLLKPINPSVIIILGIYTVAWGIWILNPFWTVFTQAALYSAMNGIFGEWFWGSIAVAAGLVIIRGAIKPSYQNLHFGAFTACLHWFVIAILYFIGDWQNTGGITALAFCIYAAFIWVNIKINKRLYQND